MVVIKMLFKHSYGYGGYGEMAQNVEGRQSIRIKKLLRRYIITSQGQLS